MYRAFMQNRTLPKQNASQSPFNRQQAGRPSLISVWERNDVTDQSKEKGVPIHIQQAYIIQALADLHPASGRDGAPDHQSKQNVVSNCTTGGLSRIAGAT
ncbi:hypothetical protein VTO42DRAFT_6203 [Malbranchea cinnamomea]